MIDRTLTVFISLLLLAVCGWEWHPALKLKSDTPTCDWGFGTAADDLQVYDLKGRAVVILQNQRTWTNVVLGASYAGTVQVGSNFYQIQSGGLQLR